MMALSPADSVETSAPSTNISRTTLWPRLAV
ncbi:Uncharacterised protein [Vibrio cholerae]|nr:Uncharacterised protein [Vibrio cholerae]